MDKLKELLNQLAQVNPRCARLADSIEKVKPHERLLMARALDVADKQEEEAIQAIIDLLEPVHVSHGEEEKVRREIEKLDLADPAVEKEWEQKLQEAREKDKSTIDAIKKGRAAQYGATGVQSNNLSEVKGLGEKSILKLIDVGIKTADEFHALSYAQKCEILGHIVAVNFKPVNEDVNEDVKT